MFSDTTGVATKCRKSTGLAAPQTLMDVSGGWMGDACGSKLHHVVEYLCSSTRTEDVAPAPNAAACQMTPSSLWADLGQRREHSRPPHGAWPERFIPLR